MEAWNRFLSEIEKELGVDAVRNWIPKLVRFDAANVFLEAKDSFQASWFEEHVRPRLKGLVNNNQRPIKVHLGVEKKGTAKKEESRPFILAPDPMDGEMGLEHFVPAESNLVVYKLLKELPPFNPIYIYGPKGSGKTHLLMGTGLELQKKGKRVFFVRAETFTEHVVQAIRLGQMREFRRIYRDIDVLIIDDIHIFSKKNATQEEFFHTFNTLHTMGRLILLSANVAPGQLTEVEPRLVSRFEWGIALGMGKSDIRAILEKKAALWKMNLAPELLNFVVEKFRSNPVMALKAIHLRGITTIPVAERMLADLLEKEEEHALTFEKIVKAVTSHYGVTPEDLLGKSQMREVALPRQVAMYLCRERLKMPYQKIGELFGRDHSTVMSSVKGIEEKKLEMIL
jgi:chromosomal replication initiator protein